MSVYLIHFSARLGTEGRNSAQHYVGWTPDDHLLKRFVEHRSGTGASITAAAVHRGFELELAVVYPGGRLQERLLKSGGHFAEYCPLCSPCPRVPRWANGTTPSLSNG